MKEYSKIIILAPEIVKDDNGEFKFDGKNISFRYNIENDPYEFRFKAAKNIYINNPGIKFILVGGLVKNTKNIEKVEVMKHILETKYKIPSYSLILLHSNPNTEGNVSAVKLYLLENKNNNNKIGLLTNFYHIPRAIKMFIDIENLYLIPVCAESIIYRDEFEEIHSFYYQKKGFSKILENKKYLNSEIKGMSDQESGSYVSKTE